MANESAVEVTRHKHRSQMPSTTEGMVKTYYGGKPYHGKREGFVKGMVKKIFGTRKKKKKEKKGTYADIGKGATGSIQRRQRALDEATKD